MAVDNQEVAQSKVGPVPLRGLLVFPVLISITNYGLLALLDISKAALHPLFLSTPIAFGGLGLSPPTVSATPPGPVPS